MAATSDDARRLTEHVGSQASARRSTDAVQEVAKRILSRPESPERVADESSQAKASRERRWKELIDSIGRRYEPCRLSTFEFHGDARRDQSAALHQLADFAANITKHVAAGGNMILYGPPGTGKDHLLVALLHHAVYADLSAEWINGQDLFGKLRDRIDTQTTEEKSIRDFCESGVLAISDPVPPKGEASSYSATMLYRIIDRRYRELKSTWVTMNVADAAEATRELTGPVFDRLADNCMAVYCNWPSYRRARKPKWLEGK